MSYSDKTNVFGQDVDLNGHLRPSVLLAKLEDAGSRQMEAFPPSNDDLRARGMAFVISRLLLRIDRPLREGEIADARTFPTVSRGVCLMGLFSRFAKKNTASLAYRRQMAQMISNKRIKYVGERRDGVEEVIGKGGSISIRDDEILVFSSADVLLRAKIADMDASELLSKDGVIITAPDLEHGGAVRTVIVYYVYYR